MAVIEFQSTVPLPEPIVLDLRKGYSFEPLTLKLESGDVVRISLVMDDTEISHFFEGLGSDPCIAYPVSTIQTNLTLNDVSDDELDRLHCRHPSAEKFVSAVKDSQGNYTRKEFQELRGLGKRVAEDIIAAINRVLALISTSYGQFWLRTIDNDGSDANFVDNASTMWKEATVQWVPFRPSPQEHLDTITLFRRAEYLESKDWEDIAEAIKNQVIVNDGFGLLSTAQSAFHSGSMARAMVELASTLEWAAQRFVQANLAGKIPSESLSQVLKTSFDRLLSDWVRPLVRQQGLDITESDWQQIQEIRQLRGRAAHSLPNAADLVTISRRFPELIPIAAKVVARFTGSPIPKTPHYRASGMTGMGKVENDK
jgi:hypothetical protein